MQFLERVSFPLLLLVGVAACAAPSPPPAPSPGEQSLERGFQSAALGNWDESIKASTESIKIASDETLISYSYSSRCGFQIWKGQYDSALADCSRSIRATPDYFGYPYAARGRIFAIQGRYAWALGEFDMAIELGSSASDLGGDNPLVVAFGGKARVFATSTDEKFRNKELAVKFAEKAVGLEEALETPAYKILNRDTLAAAYAEAGRFDDAIQEQKKTIAMLKDNRWASVTFGNETLLAILNRHLRQFEQRQPLRGGIY